MPFVASVANRLVCLAEGRVIADGEPKEIVRDPAVVAAYLGVAIDLGADR